jgi:hypothetical protein
MAGRGRSAVQGGAWWAWRGALAASVGLLLFAASAPVSAALPDGRRYELVSPQDKNGGDVIAVTRRVRAATNGEAAGFASLVGFAEIFGMGFSADYVATRERSGWLTRGISRRQEPQSMTLTTGGPGDRIYEGEFSEDFTKGVARVTAYPGAPANVSTVQNLLLREDLLTPGFGRYQLLTDSFVPIPPQGRGRTPSSYRPFHVDASADFGHVVFQSQLNLVADATGGFQKLYEWDHGTLRLVGVLPDGSVAPNAVAGRSVSGSSLNYVDGTISNDGSRIHFTVQDIPAVGIASGSTTGQLYLRQDASSTVAVNASEDRPSPTLGSAEFWTASADGARAFFSTAEQLVDEDTNSSVDLYRFDLEAPAGERLRLLSVDSEPADGTGGTTQLALGASDDGERVYFVVEGNQLVNGAPIPTTVVSQLVYLWDGGELKYVGKVDRAELTAMVGSDITSKTTRVTPDGRHMVFMTREGDQVVPHDHGDCGGPCQQVYVYSAEANGGAGELSCASCPPNGEPAMSVASIDFNSGIGAAQKTFHQNRAVTDDGRRVFFSTSQALVEEDRNPRYDAYQYTVATHELKLISTGRAGVGDAFFMDASASGDDVFFTTRERLVGWDRDQATDLYDARIGGGFPEPVIKRACEDDACQGPAGQLPAFDAPASIAFHGAGNVKPNRKGR